MSDHPTRLREVLERFERSPDPFHTYDVTGAIHELESAFRSGGDPVPDDLLAELIAFELVPDYRHTETGWGTYYGPAVVNQGREYPGLACITPAVVEHWTNRARTARHPLLRIRYADVVWDLSRKAGATACPPDVPRVMIDAAVEAATGRAFPHDVDAIRQLRRALSVATSLRDQVRVQRVRDAIIAFEDLIAVDHLPGLWGFSFDLLIEESRSVSLPEELEQKLIADLEARLTRLVARDRADAPADPRYVELVALRLARYYRRCQRRGDVKRVLNLYAATYLRAGSTVHPLVASASLKKVHDTLLGFDMREEAEATLVAYREVAQKTREELHPITTSVTIDRAEVDAFLDEMTDGDWDEVFFRLAGHYLPRRDEERQRLEDTMKGKIHGLFGQTVLGHDGRAVAGVGSLEQDPEGNLVRHTAQMMGYVTWSIRAVVERLRTSRQLSVGNVVSFVYRSPIFDSSKRPIVEAGLRAYLAGDWVVAIHLLVPQIEDAVRQLVLMTGGQTMKKGRNDGLLLRNLDELLRDERADQILGTDATFYLRVLLTDQRGWNVRNDVAHGIAPFENFNAGPADRLFHVMLLLGSLRTKHAESADGAAGTPEEGPEQPKDGSTAAT